jgi:hypothetical protein
VNSSPKRLEEKCGYTPPWRKKIQTQGWASMCMRRNEKNGFFDWNCCVKFFSVVESGMGATLNAGKPKKGSIVAVFGLGAVGLAVSTNNKCPLYVPLYAY